MLVKGLHVSCNRKWYTHIHIPSAKLKYNHPGPCTKNLSDQFLLGC